MYSTSLGNSAMTSTSCSRGRQKLRFQISRKLRTARDGDRDCKEVPREAEPSRAAAGAGAATAGGGPAAITENREAKDHLVLPVTVLCTPLCSHSHPSRLFLPLSASSVSCPGTLPNPGLRREGAPPLLAPRSAGQPSPGGFQQGELKRSAPTRDPARRQPSDWAALRFGLRWCPCLRRAGGIQTPRCLPGYHHGTPEVTQPSLGCCPLPAGAPAAAHCQLTGRLCAGGPPLLRGLQGGKGKLWRGGTGPPAAAPRPAPRGAVPAVGATPGSRTVGPGCPCPDPPPAPRLSPGRAVPPASRPPATAGRRRAAASLLPPPRHRLGAATTVLPPPACLPDPGPPAPPCHLRRRRAMGARPAPPPYFTATAPPLPRPGPAAGREQVPGPGGRGDGRCSRARRSSVLQRPRTASGHYSIGLPALYSPSRAR